MDQLTTLNVIAVRVRLVGFLAFLHGRNGAPIARRSIEQTAQTATYRASSLVKRILYAYRLRYIRVGVRGQRVCLVRHVIIVRLYLQIVAVNNALIRGGRRCG